MARLRASWRTSLPVVQQPRNPQSESIARSPYDTPYMEHARSYLESEGTKNPPPSYDPQLVAKAIVHACENHQRDLVVGFGGWAVSAMGQVAPRLTDFVMEAARRVLQESSNPGRPQRRDNLYAAREDGAERSSLPGGRLTSRRLPRQLRQLVQPARRTCWPVQPQGGHRRPRLGPPRPRRSRSRAASGSDPARRHVAVSAGKPLLRNRSPRGRGLAAVRNDAAWLGAGASDLRLRSCSHHLCLRALARDPHGR